MGPWSFHWNNVIKPDLSEARNIASQPCPRKGNALSQEKSKRTFIIQQQENPSFFFWPFVLSPSPRPGATVVSFFSDCVLDTGSLNHLEKCHRILLD